MSAQKSLQTPYEITPNAVVKNRFFKSAMSEQLGDKQHNPTPGLARLYRTWAEGGTGLLVTGNVMIDREALGEPKNVVLDGQSDLTRFKAWAQAGQTNGAQIWMQLNHPGKQIPKFLNKPPWRRPQCLSRPAWRQCSINPGRWLKTR